MNETAGIYGREFETLGTCALIGIAQGRVLSVEFADTLGDASPDHGILDRVEAYLRGAEETITDVEVAMTMPTDQRDVFATLRDIPYGQTVTVEQLTRMVPGRNAQAEDDRRAVADALRENPAPIFVPTHRVSDGPDGMRSDVAATLRSVEGL